MVALSRKQKKKAKKYHRKTTSVVFIDHFRGKLCSGIEGPSEGLSAADGKKERERERGEDALGETQTQGWDSFRVCFSTAFRAANGCWGMAELLPFFSTQNFEASFFFLDKELLEIVVHLLQQL